MSKPPAKTAAVSKTPAKAAPTAAPAEAAAPVKAPVKAAAPAEAAAPVKAPVKAAAAAKAAVKAPSASPTPAPSTKPPISKAAAVKTSAAKAANQPPTPVPAPSPLSNRFTDRFAPARHAHREMTEAADLPKTPVKVDPKLANAWKTKAGRELTQPELLAMPESEYMKDKQIDYFRAALQKQKDDLLSNAGETTEHLREDTSIVPDPVDRATIEEEHALELRTRDRERKLLKKIAQSMDRLENGEYGYCDETGEPIGLARLLARPTATLSLEAQQRRELKQKMFG